MKIRLLRKERVARAVLLILLASMAGMGKMVGQEYNTLTINEPDGDNSSTNIYVPFYGRFDDYNQNYSQFIIPASDLASVQYSDIQSLTFYMSKDPWGYGYSAEMPNWDSGSDQFQIYLAEVEEETFTVNAYGEYELYDEDQMSLVFDYIYPNSFEIQDVGDYYQVTFYLNESDYSYETGMWTHYQYNGGNLLVYIKPVQIVNTYENECYWSGISQYGYNDPSMIYTYLFEGNTYVDYDQSFRPMITIEYTGGEAPSCHAPQDFSATPYAHYATLNWTTDASKVNIQYKKSSDLDWTTAEENYEWGGYSYDLNDLSSQTSYDVQIQAVCSDEYGNEEYSEWSLITFTTTTPIAPTHLTASNYDTPEATTATLNWEGDMYDTPIYWDLAYTTDMNASPDNSTIITIGSDDYYNSYNMTGLTPLATYKVWIRSNFGDGEVSDWSEPCTFRPTNWENITVNSGYENNKFVPFPIAYQSSTTSQSQFIITSDKLSDVAFHELKRIAFDPRNSSWYVEALPTATVQVYLKEIAATEFAGTEYYNWEDMELVYNGAFSNSHKILEFDTPYNYAGGNLLVGIRATTEYNTSNYSNILTNYWYGISTNEVVALSNINNGATSSQPFLPKTTFYYDPTESSSCYSPIYLTATATTSTTATLDWTPNGEESAWDMYYTTDASFTPDETTTPSVIATSQKPYVIEGLTNETTYYAWVRANCGGSQSNWSQRCTFLATDRIDLTIYDGTETVYSPIYGYGSNYKKQLVIPATELEDMIYGNIHNMVFYCMSAETSWSSPFNVYVAEIANNTLEEGYEYDWAAMTQVYQGSLSVANNKMTIVFDAPYKYEGGNLLIGITTNGSPGTKTWYGTGENQPKTTFSYLPGDAPAIARPQGLAAANITESSADLSWTDMTGMSWNLRYKTAEATEWTMVTPTSNAYQMTNLTANTTYRVQVQASDGVNQSSWSYLAEFKTLCERLTVDADNPYVQDFSADPTTECWTIDNTGEYGWSYDNYNSGMSASGYEPFSSTLWMPQMHLSASESENVYLSFDTRYACPIGAELSVMVNDNPIWLAYKSNYEIPTEVIIPLDAFRNQDINVGFKFVINSSLGYYGGSWSVSNVRIGVGFGKEYDNIFMVEGNWNEANNWSSGVVPTNNDDVLIMAPSTVSSGLVAEARSITTVYDVGSLTIADGGQVNSTFNFEGTIQKTINGYGEGNGDWYLISVPMYTRHTGDYGLGGYVNYVNPESVMNLIAVNASNYDLYSFNQSEQDEWRNFKASNQYLLPFKGYLYANKNTETISYSGMLNVSGFSGDLYLTYDEAAQFKGWNLLGNPMVCNATLGNNRPFYRMNSAGTALEAVEANTAIAPMEGVFVEASSTGQLYSFSKAQNSKGNGSVNMRLSNNKDFVDDNAIISFNNCSLGKFMLNPNDSKIYIPVEGKDYAIVTAGTIGELPLNFEAAENGRYTIAAEMKEVEMSYLHLIDNLTGDDVDLLTTPSYSFDAKTTDYASRFKVVFATGSSVDTETFAFINGSGNLCIFGIEGHATVQVIDMLGHVVSSETFNGSYEKKIDGVPGVYLLRLINGNDVKVQKVVVK